MLQELDGKGGRKYGAAYRDFQQAVCVHHLYPEAPGHCMYDGLKTEYVGQHEANV